MLSSADAKVELNDKKEVKEKKKKSVRNIGGNRKVCLFPLFLLLLLRYGDLCDPFTPPFALPPETFYSRRRMFDPLTLIPSPQVYIAKI